MCFAALRNVSGFVVRHLAGSDTLYRVKKTSIYLEPSLDEALAKRAADEGLTKAEFIRRSLASVVGKPKRPKLSVGVYSGDGRSAADVDAMLDEYGFGED